MEATSSISARAATISDHGHYAAMLPELGVDDPVLAPEQWATELMPGTLLFEENGVVVAYAWIVKMGDVAYVRHVVVAKNARGRGVGHFVMREIAERMRAAGCTDWVLNVKVDNVPAIRLYTSMGFEKDYDGASMRLAWDVVARLPSDAGYSTRLIEPREDSRIEEAFNLLKNRIANVRLQNGWILMRLEDPTNPDDYGIGFACFQPQFPGCFPFRVARPELARVLLDAIRQYALTTFDYINIFVQQDMDLKRLFVAAGGKVLFEVMHMRGKIPAS